MITIPTVSQIRDQIITDIEGKLGQTIPALPKAFFRVLATALAGVMALLYRFGAWIYAQIFPQTADDEALILIGGQYGIVRSPAVAAVLELDATGASDTVIPGGTLWQNGGTVYQQTAGVSIVLGVATVEVLALTTGDATNQIDGATLSLVTPIAGVDTDATVAATITTGEDVEDLETYRARIIQRLQQRPQGGATPDYISWAGEVAGIVKAFAFNSGPGTVVVYPLISLTGTRLPGAPKLAEVQAYLEDPIRRPLCATVTADYMTERVLDITATSIQPDNADTRAAIESAWTAYLLRAYPVQYLDESNQTAVVSLSGLYAEAMGAGAKSITITMEIDGVPGAIAAYTLLDSEIIKAGVITWPV